MLGNFVGSAICWKRSLLEVQTYVKYGVILLEVQEVREARGEPYLNEVNEVRGEL